MSPGNGGPEIAFRPAKVLIVDDDRQRFVLEAMLKPEGYHITTACGGQEALDLVEADAPDLILLDVMMPDIDGFMVAGRIKGDPDTQRIPIIMVTALDDRANRLLGLTAGAADFLSKPVDRAELCVRVRNLLRLKQHDDSQDQYNRLLEVEMDSRTADADRAQTRAQSYLDTADVVLLALDTNGRITLVNRYACAVLGRTAADLLGKDWVDTCIPLRARSAATARFQALLKGDLAIVEAPVLTATDAERMIEWHHTVLHDGEGNVTGTFSSGADVTDKNRAIEGLRSAEERMRFALTNANVGIWDWDLASGVVRWSDVIEAQYGLAPGTFGGTFEGFMECIHPEDRAVAVDAIGAASKSGTDFTLEHRVASTDGKERWLRGAGRFRLDAQGQAMRGVGISQDVTESRTLERQYRQAQKMEAVGRLASGVAHDFNNLLAVIHGCAELLSVDLQGAHSENVSEILKAAQSAAGLTRQLLAFGRQQVLYPASLDVNLLISEMTVMLRRLIGEGIEVRLALADDLFPALADRSQLEQVLMNLIVNARDAMPEGGVLTIRTETADLDDSPFHQEVVMVPGHHVMISVGDTGTGMTVETKQRLFEPFFSTKELGKGTGLGLATTYGIVKQSKGYIWVYSELGVGTIFKVYLPCASQRVAPEGTGAVDVLPKGSGNETVLLVEDDPSVRRLSRIFLEDAGYRVSEAANGDEAEAIFAEDVEGIDLVVTDVVMPGCGGPELMRRLRGRDPAVKVLYTSGNSDHPALREGGAAHDHPFIQKPFAARELARQVRAALDP